MRYDCEICGAEFDDDECHSKRRYCSECSKEANQAHSDGRFCAEPKYPLYRYWLARRYGPGPWTPQRVAPEDRWEAWVARRQVSRAS